jgi:cysteine-rich repeat protein
MKMVIGIMINVMKKKESVKNIQIMENVKMILYNNKIHKKMKNKKAVSMMVSYTLLIIIAVAISIVVYSYLKLYLPSDRPECPADINLIIDDVVCIYDATVPTNTRIELTISNRGLFNVDSFFARVGVSGRKVRQQINKDSELLDPAITPGDQRTIVYLEDAIGAQINTLGEYILEVQAAVVEKRVSYPCDAISTQIIQCVDALPTACTPGETAPCLLTEGVCQGSVQTCPAEGVWPGCSSADYGSDYEQVETSCTDGNDNDCTEGADCSDPGCCSDVACSSLPECIGAVETCSDGIQNQGAGECAIDVGTTCPANYEIGTESSCSDGLDNDCDGDTDGADSDCIIDDDILVADTIVFYEDMVSNDQIIFENTGEIYQIQEYLSGTTVRVNNDVNLESGNFAIRRSVNIITITSGPSISVVESSEPSFRSDMVGDIFIFTQAKTYPIFRYIHPREMQLTGNTKNQQPGQFTIEKTGTKITAPYCGDGTVDPGEECDDGNNEFSDGCDQTCNSEEGPSPGCYTGILCQPACNQGTGIRFYNGQCISAGDVCNYETETCQRGCHSTLPICL